MRVHCQFYQEEDVQFVQDMPPIDFQRFLITPRNDAHTSKNPANPTPDQHPVTGLLTHRVYTVEWLVVALFQPCYRWGDELI